MTFQEKIVVLRKKKGLTQDEFASAVGVSRQAVYKWESGKSYPEVAKLLEIKILFGISIDDLLDENFIVELPEKKRRKRLPKEEKVINEAVVAETEEKKEFEEVAEAEAVSKTESVAAEDSAKEETVAPIAQVMEEKTDAPEKKSSFFGRLFGRK